MDRRPGLLELEVAARGEPERRLLPDALQSWHRALAGEAAAGFAERLAPGHGRAAGTAGSRGSRQGGQWSALGG